MDEIVLTSEKFEAVKELASIKTEIATAAALLRTIKDETDAYLKTREDEVLKRVDAVLKASGEALQKIADNQDALRRYASDLFSLSADLRELLEELRKYRETLDMRAKADNDSFEQMLQELQGRKKSLDMQAEQIEADRQSNITEKEWIGKEKLRLRDERATLERAFNRLKK